ncbi:hypothetical protein U1Q18_005045, partial [Sarracenia purpurea var. burkii]
MDAMHASSSCSSCVGVKSEAIITGKVLQGAKKIYLRELGRGFNSNAGGASRDGIAEMDESG